VSADKGFLLHPDATADITEIWEFIAADNLPAAVRVREELLQTFRLMAAFPKMGHLRPDLTDLPLRFHSVRSFLIAYIPDQSPVVILAVLHGSRSPRTIAGLLRRRS
jgi:plasmid stabilization system protein ParE